jgi:hypothetical protein
MRRIYDANSAWADESGNIIDVVHEFNIYQMSPGIFYFVLVIFGMEFAINYSGPYIDSYIQWLRDHNNVSPLYFGKDNAKYPRLISN